MASNKKSRSAAQSAPKPAQPVPKPAQPIAQQAPEPAQPAPKPAQPAPKPAQPIAQQAPKPTQPAPKPAQPAPKPAQPIAQQGPEPAQPTVVESKFVIFFSWQSDLPDETNRRLIREGLRNASTMLEDEYAANNLRVEVDEATRNLPGSPNIPQAIFNKIRVADAFIGDITTINAGRPEGQRSCPNPNVMIELGYSTALLGWNRIVMLFNKAHGDFPRDIPFDIDRHRIADYDFNIPRTEQSKKERATRLTELKKPLFELLYNAVKSIYLQRPPKPTVADELAPEVRSKRRDVDMLTSVLATIHIPTMDEFFERIQTGTIPHNIFHFWEGFRALVSSNLFHIYDTKAVNFIGDFYKYWGESLSFGQYFTASPTTKYYSFRAPGDIFTSDQQDAWKRMQEAAQAAHDAFRGLLKHVRDNYIEVDLTQTNKDAWIEFVEFHDDLRKRLG